MVFAGDSLIAQVGFGLRGFLHDTPCIRRIHLIQFRERELITNLKNFTTTNSTKNADIVVLNIGAWYHSLSLYESAMNELEEQIQEIHLILFNFSDD